MILVIDDDSAIRTSLSFMLKRLKYDVQAVSTPKEAIAAVRSVAPELILMDMNFSLTTSGDEGITLLGLRPSRLLIPKEQQRKAPERRPTDATGAFSYFPPLTFSAFRGMIREREFLLRRFCV